MDSGPINRKTSRFLCAYQTHTPPESAVEKHAYALIYTRFRVSLLPHVTCNIALLFSSQVSAVKIVMKKLAWSVHAKQKTNQNDGSFELILNWCTVRAKQLPIDSNKQRDEKEVCTFEYNNAPWLFLITISKNGAGYHANEARPIIIKTKRTCPQHRKETENECELFWFGSNFVSFRPSAVEKKNLQWKRNESVKKWNFSVSTHLVKRMNTAAHRPTSPKSENNAGPHLKPQADDNNDCYY